MFVRRGKGTHKGEDKMGVAAGTRTVDEGRYDRLIIALAVAMAIGLVVLGVLLYRTAYARNIRETRSEISANAEHSAGHIAQWFAELRGDALALSRSPYMSRGTEALLADRSPEQMHLMQERLQAEALSGGFLDLILFEANGRPILGSQGGERPADAEEADLIATAATLGTVVTAAHGTDAIDPHMDLAVPLLASGESGGVCAVILERVSCERELLREVDMRLSSAASRVSVLFEGDRGDAAVLWTSSAEDAEIAPSVREALGNSTGRDSGGFIAGAEGPLQKSLTLLTRVPGTDLNLVVVGDVAEPRRSALQGVAFSLAWPALAVLTSSAATGLVWKRKRRDYGECIESREQDRRRVNSRLEFLLRGSGETFFVLDEQLRIRYSNQRAPRMYGLSETDMTGQPLAALTATEYATRDGSMLRALEDGGEVTFDSAHEHADGTSFAVRCRAQAVRDDGERLYHLLIAGLAGPGGAQARIDSYQEKLRALILELARAEERERRRIASVLHDRIGQALTLLRIQLATISASVDDDVMKIVDAANESADMAIRETRSLTSEISPPVLYELGLVPALDWLAEQFSSRFALSVEIESATDAPPVERDVSIALFTCTQELLMNVVKHARATAASIVVSTSDDRIAIEVRDDGIGFSPDAHEMTARSRTSFGLFSIGERLRLLGGELVVRSRPGHETVVRIEAPLAGDDGKETRDAG